MKIRIVAGVTLMALSFAGCIPSTKKNGAGEETAQEASQQQKDTTTMKTEAPEIVTMASGLKYRLLKAAAEHADKPQRGKVVVVHYTGWLGDANDQPLLNKKFDSSVDRGQPFAFTVGVGQVIAGWDEGLLDMKKGEKRQLIIPAKLGYGASGVRNVIPPNATLIFDVELLDIK